ncbi:MFS transporter [Paenisporosarcina sp. HGH0030]|uniref:MFS transporter n=1 Tax=Paenisporosarcina sp. HGH0030 TaxID=1078085 RepID=UPI0009DB834E
MYEYCYHSPTNKELNLSQTQSGMVISSFWLSSGCMSLFAGWFSDKFGSRKVIVIATFIISLFSFLTRYGWGICCDFSDALYSWIR